ncbi:MAG: carbonic anhydrase family protein, partial [Rubrivivax sp.]
MDRLRQRLTERLSATKVNEGSTQFDLKVAAAPPAAERSPSAAAAPRNARRDSTSRPATAATEGHGWSYSGPAGPQSWGSLRPEFAQCATGTRQSPIDIRGGRAGGRAAG